MAKKILFILLFFILMSAGSSRGQSLTTVKIADGLNNPLFVTSPPGDSERLFVLEQNTALIKIIKNGTVLLTPFLDLGAEAGSGGEQGLLGLAFDPDYQSNGYFVVNYTNNSGDTVIARYKVSADPDIADASSELKIATIDQPFSNHNGGMMAFSPNDGYLYLGLGDGGSGNDPGNRAQTGLNVLGKIHRIDIDPVSIPATNPFVNDPSVSDTIWALGVRNPWRFSFDRLNGDLYIGDVGQGAVEEISWQPGASPGGENYGWRCMEGSQCTGLSGCTCNAPGLTLPIHEYGHTSGNCSVTGGYVYRGSQIPGLGGTYFFGDYCTGRIWSFRWDGANKTGFQERTAELAPQSGDTINNISSFGEDGAGEIYIVDLDGEIYKIVSTEPPPSLNLLPIDPGTAGVTNTITTTGATPGGQVAITYGTSAGSAPAESICGGLVLGIQNWTLLTTVTADGSGNASFDVFVPANLSGMSVYLQSVDVSTCTESNLILDSFDTPDAPTLLPADPGTAGVTNTITTTGAAPGGQVAITYGTAAGPGAAGSICSGLTLGIQNWTLLTTVTADGSGNASFDVFVPANLSGVSVYLQSVDIDTCVPSNLSLETFD